MDRLVRVISHDGKATVYTYDENGNRSTAKYANGITITYTYDECNRLKLEKVTDKNQKLISEYRYTTEKGERTKVSEKDSVGKEIETVYKYDECSRLLSESISVKKSGEEDVTDIQYTYDSVGSRISKTVNGLKTEYSYNELNQLIGEKIVGENASDDQSQNSSDNSKTSNVSKDSSSDSNPSKASKDSSSDVDTSYDTVYRYDKNGNLIETVSKDKKCTYTYDLFNRMTGYTDGVVNYTYTYDAEGVRRTKTCYSGDHSTTVMYITDTLTEFSQTLAETDENGQIGTCYTSGFELIGKTDFIYEVNGGSKDKIENESETNDSTVELSNEPKHEDSYYILDGHSDVRMVLGSSAEVKASYRYSAYGEILEGTADLEDGYYYTGEYMDTETGLYYLRARYMNPATATFTSMDSYAGNIYDPASLHRYLYANANPVKYTDPSGHSPLASLTTAVSQLTVLQTNAIILSMATVSGLMNMAMKTLMCVVDGKGLPSASEYGKAFIEGFYIGSILGMFSMFAAVCMNLTLLEMYLCIGGGTAAKLAIDGAIAAYKGDVKGAVINGLFALFSMAAFSKMYDVYTETTISSGPGNATKVECKPDGTCEQKNNVPSEEIDTVTVSKSDGETANGNGWKSIENTEFFKENGGLDASDYISIHSRKHMYNPDTLSTPKKTQYGKDVNVGKLCKDTIMNPDEVVYNTDQNVMIYKKKYPFNISTSETPTGTHRVYIPLNTQGKKTIRMSQFPLFEGEGDWYEIWNWKSIKYYYSWKNKENNWNK